MKATDVCPKIPEISVGSSDQNIWDHLWKWSSYFGQPKFSDSSIFDKPVHHCRTSPHLCSEFGKKEYKLVRARVLLVNSPISSDVIDPACTKYHIRALCPFLDFPARIFRGSQKEARSSRPRGSGSQARKIASPVWPGLYLQYRSEISEPKHTRNTRMLIRVYAYAHARIRVWPYAYTRMLISIY